MPLVRIKPGLSHAHYTAGEVFVASPAEVVSFGDKFEKVEPEPEPIAPVVADIATVEVVDGYDATPAAIRIAAECGLDLSTVTGAGKDGRVTAGDVRAAMEE